MVRTPGARLPHRPLEEQQWRLWHAPPRARGRSAQGYVPPKHAVSQPPCTGGETNGRRRLAKRVNDRWSPETLQLPNVEVRQHDIRTDPLEAGRYDLAHCRAVLSHLPDPHRALRRMVAAVQMGGWVVIEDADFSSLRAVEATHPLAESHNRHLRELLDRMAQAKLSDPYLGSRVRGLLEDAGLTEVDNEGVSRIARGGETDAKMLGMTLQALVERGLLSAAAYSDIQQALLDPSFSFITLTTFAAWGKRTS